MKKIKFPARSDFGRVLKQRVNHYFDSRGISPTGNWKMYLKTVISISWLVVSYVYLVFFADSLMGAVVGVFALAQGFALVGFNVMHDGAHGSYSRKKWLNRLMGYTLDLIGGSQALWRQKHNILHHTYTNLSELVESWGRTTASLVISMK